MENSCVSMVELPVAPDGVVALLESYRGSSLLTEQRLTDAPVSTLLLIVSRQGACGATVKSMTKLVCTVALRTQVVFTCVASNRSRNAMATSTLSLVQALSYSTS